MMHARFRNIVGLPVYAEDMEDASGTLSGILIEPDTGRIEGFFVSVHSFLQQQQLFLSSFDILHIGTRIIVRSPDVLSPLEDRVRLAPLLEDQRTILGQRIQTENGMWLGRCRDVQFDTFHFVVEWIFPKRFFRWGLPIPLSSIVEVRKEAIIVRDPAIKKPEVKEQAESAPILKPLPDMA